MMQEVEGDKQQHGRGQQPTLMANAKNISWGFPGALEENRGPECHEQVKAGDLLASFWHFSEVATPLLWNFADLLMTALDF